MLVRILIAILLVVGALIFVAIIRALLLTPNSAAIAEPPLVDKARADGYAKGLSRMVRIETVSSRDDIDRSKFIVFQDELETLFPRVFAACERACPGGGLVLRLPAEEKSDILPILLMSHHDVVPANPSGWEHEPFSGDIDSDGRIWGRGTVDTKGSLFCELQALEELLLSGWKNACDIYITSSCTEEWSGDSAPAIVQYLKDRDVHLGMLMDEGGMILEKPLPGVRGRYCMVGVLEKGYGDVKLIARGNGGHASTPGKNSPLVRLGKLMAYVERHNLFAPKLSGTLVELFTRLAPNMKFGMKLPFGNLWLFGPLLEKALPAINPVIAAMTRTTCAFTTARGSDALNVLPDEAYVTANMRFMPHQANEESIDKLRQCARRFDVEAEVIYQDPPCKPVDCHGWAFRLVEEVANEIYPGYGVAPYIMTGGSDAKFYEIICDNAIRFAPIEINASQYASIHGVNEHIDSSSLVPAIDFYKKILQEYKGE